MEVPRETDDSIALAVSGNSLALKIAASEDARRCLQNQIFVLEERVQDANGRVEKTRAEASMNAQGIKRCVEEKEAMVAAYVQLVEQCKKIEKECSLYEQDVERKLESCDVIGKENEELRILVKGCPDLTTLAAKVESLQQDKERLKTNLQRAEEEVNILFEENKLLEEQNQKILELLKRERHRQGSAGRRSTDATNSTTATSKGKGKVSLMDSSPTSRVIDFSEADSSRQPVTCASELS